MVTHNFRNPSPWLTGFICRGPKVRQNVMAEENCLAHGVREAERKGPGTR